MLPQSCQPSKWRCRIILPPVLMVALATLSGCLAELPLMTSNWGDGSGQGRPLRPIAVHGRVFDQYRQPVAGVLVTWSGNTCYTNDQGSFTIHGLVSDSINLEKTGYIFNEVSSLKCAGRPQFIGTYSPARFSGDYCLWKQNGAEPLIAGTIERSIPEPVEGQTYTVDLIQGTWTPGAVDGDLQITFHGPAEFPQTGKYTWSYTIETSGGGILKISANDGYQLEAPATGYEHHADFIMAANRKDWAAKASEKYYVKIRESRLYGIIVVSVGPPRPVRNTANSAPGESMLTINIQAMINPRGSRNLEYDWKNTIRMGWPAAAALGEGDPSPFAPANVNAPQNGPARRLLDPDHPPQ